MATVTGLTAARMLAIEAASVVDGDVVGDNLILTKHDGSTVNAGSVRGPVGPAGPPANVVSVLAKATVLDVGVPNQVRAGRQLTAADFTAMGLSAPAALYNLSNLSDVSGNGRNLNDKGSVPFGAGINGIAATAAVYSGSTSQSLYVTDSGATDPMRLKTGSWGCWFRTAKRGTMQTLVAKTSTNVNRYGYVLDIDTTNVIRAVGTVLGQTTASVITFGKTDVCDDAWHFVVATFNGSVLSVYVDGVLESANFSSPAGTLNPSVTEFNIGSYNANSTSNAANPMYGRIDEVFVSSDVLTPDQVRNLYCAKVAHSLGAVPTMFNVAVYRRRHHSAATSDFPSQPKRLYNFTAGVLTDAGSDNVPLTNSYTSLIVAADGVDGTKGNGYYFSGAHQGLGCSDAGLPSGLETRTYGCWFKSVDTAASMTIMAWGQTSGSTDTYSFIAVTSRNLVSGNGTDSFAGPKLLDGRWHFMVVVEDNTAGDGIKRKLYVDGVYVGGSTVMNSITLGGSTSFRVGANVNGTAPFSGHIDNVFVHNVALTPPQIRALYAVGTQELALSPKNPGDHIEAANSTDILYVFDSLESMHAVDLGVRV